MLCIRGCTVTQTHTTRHKWDKHLTPSCTVSAIVITGHCQDGCALLPKVLWWCRRNSVCITVRCERQAWQAGWQVFPRGSELRTPGYGRSGTETGVRSTGNAGSSVQNGVFKHDCTGKMTGTDQNRSFKWGVRLTRVFVRRGSTVYESASYIINISIILFHKRKSIQMT